MSAAVAKRPAAFLVGLRPAGPSDAPLLWRWRAESSVGRYQPLPEVSRQQLRNDLVHQLSGNLHQAKGERFQWIVSADGEPAGWITLQILNWHHGLAEVGFALSTPFQGRGLMPAALLELEADLFLRTRLERLEARCAAGNIGSAKALERAGFRREGLLRGYFRLRGERVDNYIYAILRQDYLASLHGGE